MSRLDDYIRNINLDASGGSGTSGGSGFSSAQTLFPVNITRGAGANPFLNVIPLNRDLGPLANLGTTTITQATGAAPRITQTELQTKLELIENNVNLSINEKANKTVDLINSTAIDYGLNDTQRLNALQATWETVAIKAPTTSHPILVNFVITNIYS